VQSRLMCCSVTTCLLVQLPISRQEANIFIFGLSPCLSDTNTLQWCLAQSEVLSSQALQCHATTSATDEGATLGQRLARLDCTALT
jgi:hypothetical protein